jgi:hypothetical protein
MDHFDATLKRAFAEAPEPEDQGFTVRVSAGVAKRERGALGWVLAQRVGFVAAGLAIAFGALQFILAIGPQIMASFGLELARAHGAVSGSSLDMDFGAALANLSVGLPQIMLVIAVLAGGAVAYRTAQE